MLLSKEEIWATLNGIWELEETGQSSITYPSDPNLVQGKAIAKAQLKKVVDYLTEYSFAMSDNSGDVLVPKITWQALLKEIE